MFGPGPAVPRRSLLVRQYGQPSPTLIALALAVVKARAEEQLVRPRIEALQRQALQQHEYHVNPLWVAQGLYEADQTRILEPAQAYEMGVEQLESYGAACDALYRAAGYDLPAGHCPLAIAENERSQAERVFGLGCRELRLPVSPDDFLEHGDLWPQFVQMMLGLVLYVPEPADRHPEPGIR